MKHLLIALFACVMTVGQSVFPPSATSVSPAGVTGARICTISSSSATAYVGATSPAMSTYPTGVEVRFTANQTSGTAPTLNCGGGALAIRDALASAAIPTGFMESGYVYTVRSNGTYWLMQEPAPGAAGQKFLSTLSVGGTVTANNLPKAAATVGDCTTDDGPAINSALSSGRPVVLGVPPGGCYAIATTISPGAFSQLRGVTAPYIGHGVVLKWIGAADGTLIHVANNVSDVVLENLSTDGNALASVNIHVEVQDGGNTQRPVLKNLYFYNYKSRGLVLGKNDTATFTSGSLEEVLMENLVFRGGSVNTAIGLLNNAQNSEIGNCIQCRFDPNPDLYQNHAYHIYNRAGHLNFMSLITTRSNSAAMYLLDSVTVTAWRAEDAILIDSEAVAFSSPTILSSVNQRGGSGAHANVIYFAGGGAGIVIQGARLDGNIFLKASLADVRMVKFNFSPDTILYDSSSVLNVTTNYNGVLTLRAAAPKYVFDIGASTAETTYDGTRVIVNKPLEAVSFRSSVGLGSQLVTNGTFASDTGWVKGTGWTIADGVAHAAAVDGGANLSQDMAFTAGLTYNITYTIANISGGIVQFIQSCTIANTNGAVHDTAGTYTEQLVICPTASGTPVGRAKIIGLGPVTADVDNVSVRVVGSNSGVTAHGSSCTITDTDGGIVTGITCTP